MNSQIQVQRSTIGVDKQDKLYNLYKHLFEEGKNNMHLEKKKTQTSGILSRQVSMTLSGFVQKNKKEIPYDQDIVVQRKSDFDKLSQPEQTRHPWSKTQEVARVIFCRKADKISKSVTVNELDKPTYVYFDDEKTLQDYINFTILARLKEPTKNKIWVVQKLYQDSFLRKIREQFIRYSKDKCGINKKLLIEHKNITNFNQIALKELITAMIEKAKQKKKIIDEKIQKEKLRKQLLENLQTYASNQTYLQDALLTWLIRSEENYESEIQQQQAEEDEREKLRLQKAQEDLLQQQMQKRLQEEQQLRIAEEERLQREEQLRVAEEERLQRENQKRLEEEQFRIAQAEEQRLQREKQKRLEEEELERIKKQEEEEKREEELFRERMLMKQRELGEQKELDEIILDHLQRWSTIDENALTPSNPSLRLSNIRLVINKDIRLNKPKVTIVFIMSEETNRRKVQSMVEQQCIQQQDWTNMIQQKNVYFYETAELKISIDEQYICDLCNTYLSNGDWLSSGNLESDQVHFFVSDEEIDIQSNERKVQQILHGSLQYFQLFAYQDEPKCVPIQVQLSKVFSRSQFEEDSFSKWRQMPILTLEVQSQIKDRPLLPQFTEKIKQISSYLNQPCSFPHPIYSLEIFSYPLTLKEICLLKNTKGLRQRRLTDLLRGLHNTFKSYSNSKWSSRNLIKTLKEMKQLGAPQDFEATSPLTLFKAHSQAEYEYRLTSENFDSLNFALLGYYSLNPNKLSSTLSNQVLMCFKRGLHKLQRCYILPHALRWMQPQVQKAFQLYKYGAGQQNKIDPSLLDGDFNELHHLIQGKLNAYVVDAINENVEEFFANKIKEASQLTFETICGEREQIKEQVKQVLEVQAFINNTIDFIQFYRQLVPLAYRLIQLYKQEQFNTDFSVCRLFITAFLSSIAYLQNPQQFNFKSITREVIIQLFLISIMHVNPQIKMKLLSLNAEFVLVNHILGCFSDFFHWEAWVRVTDWLIGYWWVQATNQSSNNAALLLIAISISIYLENEDSIMQARSREELQAILKVYGQLTVDIDKLIKRASQVIDDLISKENTYLQKASQFWDEDNQNYQQLDLNYQLIKEKDYSLAHIELFLQLQKQSVVDPEPKFTKYEQFEIDVPEEHENSMIRDIDFQDIPQANIPMKIIQPLQCSERLENIPKLAPLIRLKMIYVRFLAEKVREIFENQEVRITYADNEIIAKNLDPQKLDVSAQFVFTPENYLINISIVKQKDPLMSCVVDIRAFKPDNITSTSVDLQNLKEKPYIRNYQRSCAQLTLLISSYQESDYGRAGQLQTLPIEIKCLQHSLYEEHDSVVRARELSPAFLRSLVQLNQKVVGFENIQWYAFMRSTWKSSSTCSYDTFKKVIKAFLNVDSTQFQLNQLGGANSSQQQIFMFDFLVNLVVQLPGSFKQKIRILYDILEFYVHPHRDVVQAFTQYLYKVLGAPINIKLEETIVLRATIEPLAINQDISPSQVGIIDFTTQLNLITLLKSQKFFNQDLLFVDSSNNLQFLQQILLPSQIVDLKNMRVDAYKVYIKIRTSTGTKKYYYQINQQFQLIGERYQVIGSPIDNLLRQSDRIISFTDDNQCVVTKQQFEATLQECPGLEFLLNGNITQQGLKIEDLGQATIKLYWAFRPMIIIYIIVEENHNTYEGLSTLKEKFKKFKENLLEEEIPQYRYCDEPLIEFELKINSIVIPFKKLMEMIEIEVMQRIMDEGFENYFIKKIKSQPKW